MQNRLNPRQIQLRQKDLHKKIFTISNDSSDTFCGFKICTVLDFVLHLDPDPRFCLGSRLAWRVAKINVSDALDCIITVHCTVTDYTLDFYNDFPEFLGRK